MTQTKHTQLRWPSWLRQAVVEAGLESGRSMNGEIIHRLKSTFTPAGLEITHGHLMPCPCGAGRPDAVQIMQLAGGVLHMVGCGSCGRKVEDESEGGAAIRWNAMVRGKAGRVAG